MVGLRPRFILYEKSRRGWHVLIKLNEKLRPAAMVALQAVLGSDSRREALNLMRALYIEKNHRRVSAFWEKAMEYSLQF
jgi:hypothetical protein